MSWSQLRPLGLLVLFLNFDIFAVEELSPVSVTADKTISPFYFGTTESLHSEDLKDPAQTLFTSSLDKIPGIISAQSGGPGGRTSFFIRGTESRHVAFTLDGLKLNDPSNTDRQFDAAFLTQGFIREVNLHKGPQAILFGSDAMGGIVELQTRKGEDAPVTRLNMNAGNFATFGFNLSSDWKVSQQQGTVTYSKFRTDGISRLNKKRFGASEQDGSSSQQLTSSSRHKLSSKLQTDILLSHIRGENELDGAVSDNIKDRSLNKQLLTQQRTTFTPVKNLAFSLRNGRSAHERDITTKATGKNAFEGSILQHEALLDYHVNSFRLLTGLSTEHEELVMSGQDRSFDLHASFFQALLNFGALSWQGGLRAERHTRYGNFLTGSTGLKYNLNQHEFSYQYSQGFKAPSLYQLHAPPLFGFPIGYNELIPETNRAHELKWQNHGQYIDSGLTIFQNQLTNLITFSNQGFRNQGHFTSEGVELFTQLKQESYLLQTSLTHQAFKGAQTTVLRRPYNLLQLSASWFVSESQEIFSKWRWFSARKDFDQNGREVKLNSFETLDLGYKQSWGKHDLSLQFINILDREYEELYGYSIMPRSIFSGYGYQF